MKANVLLPVCLALAVLSACAPKAAPPAPAPRPIAIPAPAPQAVPRPARDWRDVPLTAGTWTWTIAAARSTASFGLAGQVPLVQLTCLTKGTVQLAHLGAAASPIPLGITTSSGTFPLMSDPVSPGASGITATLPAGAAVLDAMAHSRGRFVIDVPGQPPSYLPAWPEVARVVEDCR